MEGKEPFQPLTHPDIIVGSTSYCIVMQKWLEALGDLFKVPVINIDVPFVASGVEKKEVVDYTKEQLLDFICYLERFTGKRFDEDKFAEIVAQGQRTAAGYRETIDTAKADPCPVTYFDVMAHNFPNIALRYKPEAEEHYKLLNAEIKGRIVNRVEAFEGMKYRIYWDGVPFWFAMRTVSQKLMELGMCLVTSAYSEVFSYSQLDASRPLESEAEAVALIYLNRTTEYKAEFTKRLYREFKCDGGVYAYAQCCKPFSITMRPIMDTVTKDLGIPNIVINGDLVDHRYYNEEESFMRLEAFAEELAARKKA
jgi:benzoyl-CoA reductase/2-hydroxyglutaryl-CoA dehydratase subunit BcrC/BadD/HgdB